MGSVCPRATPTQGRVGLGRSGPCPVGSSAPFPGDQLQTGDTGRLISTLAKSLCFPCGGITVPVATEWGPK